MVRCALDGDAAVVKQMYVEPAVRGRGLGGRSGSWQCWKTPPAVWGTSACVWRLAVALGDGGLSASRALRKLRQQPVDRPPWATKCPSWN